ncbi:MAG: hypothetical protein KME64_40375 [Scytonematopsis contorta HA4267-MV1]|jgi:hypothetical protein|nr:hypothetical protein [Scytonematopsis contorta HA4267-MV1]
MSQIFEQPRKLFRTITNVSGVLTAFTVIAGLQFLSNDITRNSFLTEPIKQTPKAIAKKDIKSMRLIGIEDGIKKNQEEKLKTNKVRKKKQETRSKKEEAR